MPILRVNHREMEAGAGALTHALHHLTAQLDDLKAKNAVLTHDDTWQGGGRDEYLHLATKFHNDATKLVQDLKPLADYVSGSNDDFRAVSNQARNTFS